MVGDLENDLDFIERFIERRNLKAFDIREGAITDHFIAEAVKCWPAAIKRAIEAEDKLDRLTADLRILQDALKIREDAIIVHDGKQYRKVARIGKAGELVIIEGNTSSHYFPIGTVARWSGGNKAEYLDGHDWWLVKDEDYRVLVPVDSKVEKP